MKYRLKIPQTPPREVEIGMLQGGVFQLYKYTNVGLNDVADWKHLLKSYTDPDLNRLRKPGDILDPNGQVIKLEEFLPLLDHAAMVEAPEAFKL